MVCPNRETLEALASGSLGGLSLSEARSHVAGCEACTAWLRGRGDDTTEATVEGRPLRAHVPAPGRSSDSRAPGDHIGPYVLGELLGAGGMGAVYTAHHLELDRKVALKILLPRRRRGPGGEDAETRFLREAQAMARLDHPNVVAVHDVGAHEGTVYLVMDRVEGQTLRGWLISQPRTWRQIVEVFIQAGRGLAAAHRAAIIHRDFKPSNVLVGHDGRVRVTDFGLARSMSAEDPPLPGPLRSDDVPHKALSSPLTVVGTVLGTPNYMAPEQLKGVSSDPRSDQFSFCVALYQALYGALPLGRSAAGQARAEAHAALDASKVPRGLRRTIDRGLSTEAADRFASMDELLAALERDRARPSRTLALACATALIALVGGGLAGHALHARADSDCREAKLTSVWNPRTREALRKALAAAGTPAAAADADRVARTLDADVSGWEVEHGDACRAAESRAEDEGALMRLVCLRRERAKLQGLVDVLSAADPQVAAGASLAVQSILPAKRCADPRVLSLLPAPPADPKVRRAVDVQRIKLASANVLVLAGRPKEALPQLRTGLADAEHLGSPSLESEAGLVLGQALRDVGEDAAAQAAFKEAEERGELGGADGTAAEAAAWLAMSLSDNGKVADAQNWLDRAHRLLDRSGDEPFINSTVEKVASAVAVAEGRDDEAISDMQKAAAYADQAFGSTDRRALIVRVDVGMAYEMTGRPEQARQVLLQIKKQLDEVYGPGSAGMVLLTGIAEADTRVGDFAGADAALVQARAFVNRELSPDSSWIPYVLADLAALRAEQDQLPEALELAEQADEQARKNGEKDQYAAAYLALKGEVLQRLGQDEEAVPVLARARDLYVSSLGAGSYELAAPLCALGSAELDLGRADEALAFLRKAQEILERHHPVPGQLARLRFALARALLAGSHPDRPRATAYALQARGELADLPWKKSELATLDEWMRRNGLPLTAQR